jgi:phytoene synthase
VTPAAQSECVAVLRRHSKSFALASALLPRGMGHEIAAVYAWCRRADDAVDSCQGYTQRAVLAELEAELDALYAGLEPRGPVLSAFGEVLRERSIPKQYPADLLAGMQMDVRGVRYDNIDQLLSYCYCVASTVGLMSCHVMGVSDVRALRHAAHLGVALQLTNICRDVLEDWGRDRLYLPADVLARHGVRSLDLALGGRFPDHAAAGCRGALRELLALADRYYASGRAGLVYLSPRCAFAVDTARRVYRAIGAGIARHDYDVRAPRAVVSLPRKLALCAAAATHVAWHVARRRVHLSLPTPSTPHPTVIDAAELVTL